MTTYQQQILRLKVAIGDPLFVAVLNSKDQFPAHFLGVILRVMPFLDNSINQVPTSHTFQHQIRKVRFVVNVIQFDNVITIGHHLKGSDFVM